MRQRRNQLFVYRAAGLALSLTIHALIIFAPIGMRAVRQPFVVSLNIDELREADVLSREAPKVIQDPIGQIKQIKQELALKQIQAPETTQQLFEKEAILPQAEAPETTQETFGKKAAPPQTETPEIQVPDKSAVSETIAAKEPQQERLSAKAEIAREIPGPSALEAAPAPARAMSEMSIEASATLPAAPAVPIEAPAVPIAESEVQQFAPAEPPAKPAPQVAQAFAQAAPQAARSTKPTLSNVPADALQPTPSQALSVPQAEKPLPAKPKLALFRDGLASSLIALPQSISKDVPAGQKQAKGAISRSSVSTAPSSAAKAPQEGVFHDDAEEIRAEHVNDFLAKRKSGSLAAFQGEQKPENALVPASLHESQLQPIAQGSIEASSAGSLGARAEGIASLTNQRPIQNDFGSANAVVEVREQSRADGALARSDASEPSGIDAPESPKSAVSASDLDTESPLILEKPLERDPLEPARAEPVQAEPARSKSASMESAPASYDTVESLAAAIAGKLAAQKQYPAAALKRKSEGTVRIALQVAPDGTLASLAIQSRSGSAILDEAALQLVRSIFPLHIRLETAVSLLIPVEYRIPR